MSDIYWLGVSRRFPARRLAVHPVFRNLRLLDRSTYFRQSVVGNVGSILQGRAAVILSVPSCYNSVWFSPYMSYRYYCRMLHGYDNQRDNLGARKFGVKIHKVARKRYPKNRLLGSIIWTPQISENRSSLGTSIKRHPFSPAVGTRIPKNENMEFRNTT